MILVVSELGLLPDLSSNINRLFSMSLAMVEIPYAAQTLVRNIRLYSKHIISHIALTTTFIMIIVPSVITNFSNRPTIAS